jgi:hypothetical protein
MPNDVKAYLSVAAAIVAVVLAYWSGSPVRPEFGPFLLGTAAFMIVAMWIFPEAGGKKRAFSVIEFIDENGGGPGVRLRKRHQKKS